MLRLFVDKAHKFLQQGMILFLRGYQYFISPLLGQRCRFYPSCSQYAIEALTKCNFFKGCYLIIRRLLRCHPFHPGGVDLLDPSHNCKTLPYRSCKNVR